MSTKKFTIGDIVYHGGLGINGIVVKESAINSTVVKFEDKTREVTTNLLQKLGEENLQAPGHAVAGSTNSPTTNPLESTQHCEFCNSPIPNGVFFKCFICNTRYCSLECLSRHDAIMAKSRVMNEENNMDWGGQENE